MCQLYHVIVIKVSLDQNNYYYLTFSYADIAKSMKQEGAEADSVSEAEVNRGKIKEAPTDDAMVSMSPSYMSEASDAFAPSYQLSQVSEQVI